MENAKFNSSYRDFLRYCKSLKEARAETGRLVFSFSYPFVFMLDLLRRRTIFAAMYAGIAITRRARKFQWYTLRATDSTLASNKDIVFALTHFPHVFFVSSIFPLNFSGWNNTKIENNRKITTVWEIQDKNFGSFLVHRSIKLLSSIESSTDDEILKALEKSARY
jgi:hypothetical protein